jgi:hypothetical protein
MADLEARDPVNRLTECEHYERRYCIAFMPPIGKAWRSVRMIKVHIEFWIDSSSMHLYRTIPQSLLKGCKRFGGVGHFGQELSPECLLG